MPPELLAITPPKDAAEQGDAFASWLRQGSRFSVARELWTAAARGPGADRGRQPPDSSALSLVSFHSSGTRKPGELLGLLVRRGTATWLAQLSVSRT